MKRILVWVLGGAAALVVVAYLGILSYLYVNQRAFFFSPAGEVWEIAEAGLMAEAVSIPVGEESVNGWYAPPAPGMPAILYLKGNSGSFTAEYERFAAFAVDGYGFLSFDYRGFPLSPGTITEANILADALAGYDWLAARGDPVVIWGRSLGSAPATFVASERDAAALLLETPMYSAVSVAAERYPYAPVGLLMLDPFRTNEWIGAVTEPVFIAHGTADTVVSVGNGERLFAEAPNGSELWIEEGAGHGDFWSRGIWTRAKAFFESIGETH